MKTRPLFVLFGLLLCTVLGVRAAVASPPHAGDDSYNVAEGGALSRIAPGLLLNDSGIAPLVVTTQPVAAPSYGTLTLTPDGAFTYVHDGSETDEDSFVYEVCEEGGAGACSTATVIISVSPVNDPPTAVDESEAVAQGGTLTRSAPGLLGNDRDPEGDDLAISPTAPLSGPSHGTLTLEADGAFTYTHDNSQTAADAFTYQVCDNGTPSGCDTATVTININNVNDAPQIVADTAAVDEGGTLSIPAPGVLQNDSDPDGDTLSVNPTYATSGPAFGSLTLRANGAYTYVHDGGESRGDSFVYRACDNGTPRRCASAEVTITVNPVNDPPQATDDTISVAEGETVTLAAPGLLEGDVDPDSATLRVSATPVSAPAHGTVTLSPDGAVRYSHDGSETETDSFVYEVCDDATPAACDTAVVTVLITPVNDAPQVDLNGPDDAGAGFSATFSTNGGPVRLTAPDLLVADPDSEQLASATVTLDGRPDGAAEVLTVDTSGTPITSSFDPASGVLTLNGAAAAQQYERVLGTVRYSNAAADPDPATRTVDFRASDGAAVSDVATTTLTVQDPGVTISVEPNPQVVGHGETAVFNVTVSNSGNVPLSDVRVADDLAPACNRLWASLAVGASERYTCERPNVTASFINVAVVTAVDPLGGTLTARDETFVNLTSDNVALAVTPAEQTIGHGETAVFDIVIVNTSTTADLRDVTVRADTLPGCGRTISRIAAGSNFSYRCTLPDVTRDVAVTVTVTANDATSGTAVSASAVAKVTVFDMALALSASGTTLTTPGGRVVFTVRLTNDSTSRTLTLAGLFSPAFGDLTDERNFSLLNTTCREGIVLPADGGTYACTFAVEVARQAGPFGVEVMATAVDQDGQRIVRSDAVTLSLIQRFSLPIIADQGRDEPNNVPCQSFQLLTNKLYRFLAEDTDDWYSFDLIGESRVTIELAQFASENGQIAVWRGGNCNVIGFVQNATVTTAAYTLELGAQPAGRYYVHVFNAGELEEEQPYKLTVRER